MISVAWPTPVGRAQSAPPLTPWRGFVDHVSATLTGGVPQTGVEVGSHSISGDGRFVVMQSLSPELAEGDVNWTQDIFLRDRQTGTMSRLSVAPDGSDADGFSDLPAISTNGRHVAFASSASNLVAGDANGTSDIFVRDLDAARTVRVSVATDGTESDGYSYFPFVSATGRFVGFVSQATTLAPGTAQYGPTQVYVHDRDADGNGTFDEPGGTATTLESVSSSGAIADNFSQHPRISADGRFVLFESTASNLDPVGNPNSNSHVYVRDRQTGTTALIDRAVTGGPSLYGTDYRSADMTDDGRFITYTSYSPDIVPADGNWNSQVLRYDSQAEGLRTSIVTVLPDGTLSDGYSFDTSISADGRYVAFRSTANNLGLPAKPENAAGVFVRDMSTGTFTRVDVLSNGEGFDHSFPYAPSISADGTAVAFESPAVNAVDGQYTFGSQHSFVVTAFSVGATPVPFPMEGGAGSIDVNTLPNTGWNAASLDSWITLTDGGGFATGPRTVVLAVEANGSGIVRQGRIKLGSTLVTIQQAGDGDTTPPVITPIVTGTLHSSGWYTSDISVQWIVNDPDSEFTITYGCYATTFTSDFIYASPGCEATSHGGTTSVTLPLRRDTTPPTIAINSPLSVFYTTGSTITPAFGCTDVPGSGVASCERVGGAGPLDTTTPGWHPFTITATDEAGNTASKTVEYLIGSGACAAQFPSLSAWWRMNGSLFDTVGHLYASPSYAAGWFDGGVAGQGWTSGASQNYLVAADESRLALSSAMTIAMWVKPTGFSGSSGTLATKPAYYRIARYPDGTLRWAFSRTTGYAWVNTGVVIPYQQWSHVALTYDNGVVTSYVNGRLVHTQALAGSPMPTGDPNAPFTIAGRADILATLIGTYDDVQVYGGAMTAADVEALANAGSGSVCVPNGSTLTVGIPSTIDYGSTFRVTAVLRDEGGNPLPNRQVWLNSHIAPGGFAGGVSGTTDAAGQAFADFPVLPSAALGEYARAASVVFEGDAGYRESSAQASATLVAGTPVVNWPPPSSIVYGTALGGAQLNATASLAGSFSYSPAAGSVLGAGTHTLTVTFTPDDASHWAPVTKTATLTVDKAATSITWANPAAVVYGTALSAAQLNATATVPGTFTYSPAAGTILAAGAHAVSVTFTPTDSANYTGASAVRTLTVVRAPLAITAGDAVKPFGAPLPPFSASATGLVNGDTIGSLGGGLTFTTTATASSPVGTYPIVPQGLTSPNYDIVFVNGALAVVHANTAVALAISSNPSGFSQPVTYSASISVLAPGAGAPGGPAGVVQFFDGGTLVGTAALASGTASLTTNGLAAGSHTIAATYSGDASFAASSATASLTVRPSSTSSTTTLTSTRNPSNPGQSVTFRAAVSSPSGGVSGTVDFYDGTALLGSAAISAGVAQFTTASLPAGGHAIAARFRGNASLPPSLATPLAQTVGSQSKSSSIAVSISPAPAVLGGEVTITATVTGGQQKAPTGSVLFIVNGEVLGEAAVAATGTITSEAVLVTSALPRGTHSVVVLYLSDAVFRASARSTTLTVN